MTLIALFLTAAWADTYQADMYVPNDVPYGQPAGKKYSAIVGWPDVAVGEPDMVVGSDWQYITCRVDDGSVAVVFDATPEDNPGTIPSTATCTYGAHALVITLHPFVPAPYMPGEFVPSDGISYDLSPVIGTNPVHQLKLHPLPVGPAYIEGSWPARLSPTLPWAGVECGMFYHSVTGDPKLWIRVEATASADEGYCVLESSSGVPHAIPLTFVR